MLEFNIIVILVLLAVYLVSGLLYLFCVWVIEKGDWNGDLD